ncbi:MAG: segregation/condensation protein A [Clostridiales bacterium]|jgi:segregation and condensation protein A|nr:segregation/condensation protein A [Clostridiales bacterium]
MHLRLDVFEGPMDLLLHLIDKNELDIYDIPIAELADQYVAYIGYYAEKDMESMSEFVLMAATLLEIKSKMLLPRTPQGANPEDDEDPRAALVEKLIEYKRFKSVISVLKEKEALAERAFFKAADPTLSGLARVEEPVDLGALLDGLTADRLYKAFQEVLNRRELKTDKVRSGFNSVSKDLYTIEEKIEHIENLLTLYQSVKFYGIFSPASGKSEKIVTFLALLELIKMKRVTIRQEKIFDEIIIYQWENEDRYAH